MRRAAVVRAATFALFAELPLYKLPLYKLPFAKYMLNQISIRCQNCKIVHGINFMKNSGRNLREKMIM
jgi:hypothetical protein